MSEISDIVDSIFDEAKSSGCLSLFNKEIGEHRQEVIHNLLIKIASADIQLSKLDLAHNNITHTEAVYLSRCLSNLTSLTELYLSFNKIGDGIITLAPSLGQLRHLSWLGLTNNCITDEGALALAPVLGKMDNLITLGLRENEIGDIGCNALAPVLASLPHLTVLIADPKLESKVAEMRPQHESMEELSPPIHLEPPPIREPSPVITLQSVYNELQELRAEIAELRVELRQKND